MANIAISELQTESVQLKDNDLVLVSNSNNNGSFTSCKMLGSKLKQSIKDSIPTASSSNPGVVTVDSVLSTTSTNPVQNKTIAQTINSLQDTITKINKEISFMNLDSIIIPVSKSVRININLGYTDITFDDDVIMWSHSQRVEGYNNSELIKVKNGYITNSSTSIYDDNFKLELTDLIDAKEWYVEPEGGSTGGYYCSGYVKGKKILLSSGSYRVYAVNAGHVYYSDFYYAKLSDCRIPTFN